MKVVSNKDETIRLFRSDFLELFTRVHWSVPLVLYGPVLTYFVYIILSNSQTSYLKALLFFGLGLLSWTFLEYLIHRFVFHYSPRSTIGKRLLFLFHGIHHAYPSDSRRLVMPPAVSIPLGFIFYGLSTFIFPKLTALPFFCGLLVGYISYDMIHYATHHLPMKGMLLSRLKRYHLRHHFQDEERGYGVSSPLWDYVFHTQYLKKYKSKLS